PSRRPSTAGITFVERKAKRHREINPGLPFTCWANSTPARSAARPGKLTPAGRSMSASATFALTSSALEAPSRSAMAPAAAERRLTEQRQSFLPLVLALHRLHEVPGHDVRLQQPGVV